MQLEWPTLYFCKCYMVIRRLSQYMVVGCTLLWCKFLNWTFFYIFSLIMSAAWAQDLLKWGGGYFKPGQTLNLNETLYRWKALTYPCQWRTSLVFWGLFVCFIGVYVGVFVCLFLSCGITRTTNIITLMLAQWFGFSSNFSNCGHIEMANGGGIFLGK